MTKKKKKTVSYMCKLDKGKNSREVHVTDQNDSIYIRFINFEGGARLTTEIRMSYIATGIMISMLLKNYKNKLQNAKS